MTKQEVKEEMRRMEGDPLVKQRRRQVQLQLTRDPRPLPTVTLNPEVSSIFEFDYADFHIAHYDPHPHIKGAISV